MSTNLQKFGSEFRSLVSIQGPEGYGPSTLPLRHSEKNRLIVGDLRKFATYEPAGFQVRQSEKTWTILEDFDSLPCVTLRPCTFSS